MGKETRGPGGPKRAMAVLWLTWGLGAAAPAVAQGISTPTAPRLTTAEGGQVPARKWPTGEADRAWVLVFHQGATSGPAEYGPIAPRVHALGFDVLVIDQRRGGDLFGGANDVAARFDAERTSYCDALPELEAALDHARSAAPGRRAILWGSSYSAALVVQLAARRAEDVAGVLAFSPASGESMDGCRPEAYLDRVEAPILAVRPASEMAHEWIAEQLERFRAVGHRTLVTDPGRHGSSTLVEERVGAATDDAWAVVGEFLAGLTTDSPGRR